MYLVLSEYTGRITPLGSFQENDHIFQRGVSCIRYDELERLFPCYVNIRLVYGHNLSVLFTPDLELDGFCSGNCV